MTTKVKLITLSATILMFGIVATHISSIVNAVNPAAPFVPGDNQQNPNCLPTDSNCYVTIPAASMTGAVNGLNVASGNVQLGGNLTGATTVTNNGNDLTIDGSLFDTVFKSDGRIGIGTTNPGGNSLQIINTVANPTSSIGGINVATKIQPTADTALGMNGVAASVNTNADAFNYTAPTSSGGSFTAQHNGTGSVTDMRGIFTRFINASTGTISNAKTLSVNIRNDLAGNITNAYGISVDRMLNNGTIGNLYLYNTGNLGENNATITSTYGYYAGDLTSGTQTNTPYSFYASDPNANNYFAGKTGIGTATPRATLDVTATDAIVVPVGTTAERPATAVKGMIRFNDTTGKFEGYTGVIWVDLH